MAMDVGIGEPSSCEGMCDTPEKYSCCGEATSHCASAFVGSELALKLHNLNSRALRLARYTAHLHARALSFDPPPPKS